MERVDWILLWCVAFHFCCVLLGVFPRDALWTVLVDDGFGDLDGDKVPITRSFLDNPSDNFSFASPLQLITFQFSMIVIIRPLELLLRTWLQLIRWKLEHLGGVRRTFRKLVMDNLLRLRLWLIRELNTLFVAVLLILCLELQLAFVIN